MSGCIHKEVCRHIDDKRCCTNCGDKVIIATEAGCDLQDICKHHSESGPERQKAGKAKKRGSLPSKRKSQRDYTTSNSDIKVIRNILRQWRSRGKLSENQLTALDAIGNIKTKSLTELHKEQLLNIFNDMKKTIPAS